MTAFLNTGAWARREAFELFRGFDQPCFNVCVRLDAAPLKAAVAARGQSFSLACLFLALRLANLHETFRYRLEADGRVRVHDEVHGSSTVLRADESFAFSYLDHHPHWAVFHARSRAALAAARERAAMAEPREADDALLYFTTLPWLHFTSFAHARTPGAERGIPKIAFGRALPEGARLWLPLSVEVHHALMDGLHVGRYVQALEAAMAAPEAWLGPAPARQVLLFTGHMIDAPGRPQPRFPMSKRAAAEQAIEALLDALDAGPQDVAYTQGASGGDLLFAHACQQRGVRLQLLLPLPEPQFIEASVLPATDGRLWLQAWQHVKARLAQPPRELPAELGPTPPGASPYERCNRWLLDTALAHGPEKLQLLCLWDGGGGDGPGGTRHMVEEVQRRGGRLHWIDTRRL